jgi:hypothetical protein
MTYNNIELLYNNVVQENKYLRELNDESNLKLSNVLKILELVLSSQTLKNLNIVENNSKEPIKLCSPSDLVRCSPNQFFISLPVRLIEEFRDMFPKSKTGKKRSNMLVLVAAESLKRTNGLDRYVGLKTKTTIRDRFGDYWFSYSKEQEEGEYFKAIQKPSTGTGSTTSSTSVNHAGMRSYFLAPQKPFSDAWLAQTRKLFYRSELSGGF